MGYSVAMSPRGKRLRDSMLAFLAREYHNPEDERFSEPVRDGDMSYDHGKCRIGFNYSPSEFGHHHMWPLLGWMAQKIGRRRRFHDSASGLWVTAPYVVYDGYECYPVARERPKGAEAWQVWTGPIYVCDERGMPTEPDRMEQKAEEAASKDEGYWTEIIAKVGGPASGAHGMSRFAAERLAGMRRVKASVAEEMARLDSLWAREDVCPRT
jgi:hypothetical protein